MSHWRVLPTHNKAGDLAIVPYLNDRPINRIATVKQSPGVPALENATLMASAPRLRAALEAIVSRDLLDPREDDMPAAMLAAEAALAESYGGES